MEPTMAPTTASYLRPIPEDRSDASSAKAAFQLPLTTGAAQNRASSSVMSDANNSTVGGSVVSSNMARIAGETTRTDGGEGAAAAESGSTRSPKPLNACQNFWTKRRIYLTLGGLTLALAVLLAIGLVAIEVDKAEPLPINTVPPSTATTDDTANPPPTTSVPPPAAPAPEPTGTTTMEPADRDDVATQAPTASLARTPTDPATIESIDTMLEQVILIEDWKTNQDTPQYKARHFLIHQDFLTDDIVAEGGWRVHQRFVAAELYFALGGEGWALDDGSSGYLLPALSECAWFGIACSSNEREEVAIVRVDMAGKNISGTLPPELSALSSLQELHLPNNAIQGEIPANWFATESWKNLYLLDLSQNALTGNIPAGLWDLPVLRFVYLNQNLLTGSLDDTAAATGAATKERLDYVWVNDNRLTGQLPNWFRASTAPSLRQFDASANQLTGSLPDSLPESLEIFYLSYNAINGALPETLWALPELQYVNLDHNRLTGSIPEPVALTPLNGNGASPLKHVWLTNNTLTGEIPDNFGQTWPELKQLRIEENPNLSGRLGPKSESDCLSVWPQNPTLRADCQVPVECACCVDCLTTA